MSEEVQEKTEASTSVDLSTIVGLKAGMTRIFDEAGNHVPVTVIKLIPNFISQVKTKEKEGYSSYQVSYYEKREKLITKARKGHLKKAGIESNLARSIEVPTEEVSVELLGMQTTLGGFSKDTYVDVTGVSKGKGFQGVIKRYNYGGGPATHGSHFHRTPGSIGMCNKPGRIIPGRKMPGHMGDQTKTVQNLKVVELNEEKGFLLIRGSIPGSKNGFVQISHSVKRK